MLFNFKKSRLKNLPTIELWDHLKLNYDSSSYAATVNKQNSQNSGY